MDINKLYKVRTTVIEMLTDRGYKMSPNVNIDQFKIMFEQNAMDLTDLNKTVHVFFYNDIKAFTKKDLEAYFEIIKEKYDNPIKVIFIIRDKYNAMVDKEMVAKPEYKDVEIFLAPPLMTNPTKNRLVPKHIILDQTAEKEMLEKYSVNRNQLNWIKASDPIAKYYGMKKGQIVKVIRPSPSAGEYISFRCVI